MTTTPLDARDTLFRCFASVWADRAPVIYDGVVSTAPTDKIWARLGMVDVTTMQSSLSSCVGKKGMRRFTTNGLITAELFSPLALSASGYNTVLQYAEDVRTAFQTANLDGGIIVRNGRVYGNGVVETFQKVNVVFEYEYDFLG